MHIRDFFPQFCGFESLVSFFSKILAILAIYVALQYEQIDQLATLL
jgi:hypothetical protein